MSGDDVRVRSCSLLLLHCV